MTMTIGHLSRRTGVPVKTLRKYEDLGLIYTAGRSPGNYRLFDEEALWCVGVVGRLRGLGLTLAEIRELSEIYLERTEDPIGPRLAAVLRAARGRARDRIAELQRLLERIDDYEAGHAAELSGQADFRAEDPRAGRKHVDSPPAGRS
jgi:DNA-binding transcriptional MerR regulator